MSDIKIKWKVTRSWKQNAVSNMDLRSYRCCLLFLMKWPNSANFWRLRWQGSALFCFQFVAFFFLSGLGATPVVLWEWCGFRDQIWASCLWSSLSNLPSAFCQALRSSHTLNSYTLFYPKPACLYMYMDVQTLQKKLKRVGAIMNSFGCFQNNKEDFLKHSSWRFCVMGLSGNYSRGQFYVMKSPHFQRVMGLLPNNHHQIMESGKLSNMSEIRKTSAVSEFPPMTG